MGSWWIRLRWRWHCFWLGHRFETFTIPEVGTFCGCWTCGRSHYIGWPS